MGSPAVKADVQHEIPPRHDGPLSPPEALDEQLVIPGVRVTLGHSPQFRAKLLDHAGMGGLRPLLFGADLGHAHAQSSMGVRYYYGEGVPKNHRLAMKWYLSGAAKKEPEALYNVGDLFDDRVG